MRQTVAWVVLLACVAAAVAQRIDLSTVAGTGQAGYSGDGGPAAEARLDNPFGIARGPDGALYICDMNNHVIRRVDGKGIITTVAGSGRRGYSGDGGTATKAELNEPYEVRFDRAGNMYFVERLNHLVRRVDRKTGAISTVAGTGKAGFSGDGGPATQAELRQPHSIQFDAAGNLYICDILNHRIRKVEMKTGTITTFAGTGERAATPDGAPIAGTPLNGPRAIDFDRRGDLWLALREANAVYRLDMQKRTIHHVAEKLAGPKGISIAPDGTVYIADTESHAIRRIDPKTAAVSLVLDGLKRPHGVFVDKDGVLFAGDSENHRVLRIAAAASVPPVPPR